MRRISEVNKRSTYAKPKSKKKGTPQPCEYVEQQFTYPGINEYLKALLFHDSKAQSIQRKKYLWNLDNPNTSISIGSVYSDWQTV